MKIEHRPQCHILAAPDGEYVTDIDCDCGATYYTLTSRIAKLEAALWVALNGVEIVIEPGQHAGGHIETIRRPDGSVLVRRERLK